MLKQEAFDFAVVMGERLRFAEAVTLAGIDMVNMRHAAAAQRINQSI
jgi:hypothetical protein